MCSKVVIEILREEGMYKDNGEAVVGIVCQALQEVRALGASNNNILIARLTVLHALSGRCREHRGALHRLRKGTHGLYADSWSSTFRCEALRQQIRRRDSDYIAQLGR